LISTSVGATEQCFFSALGSFPEFPCLSDLKSLQARGRERKIPATLRREFSKILQQEQRLIGS
jgi:hypothetical protein